ncbi:hypothetical protein OIU76_023106 [Salix suchowensis]|nr:hypothetical protein OIU76_023106 [Salix suchowensis]
MASDTLVLRGTMRSHTDQVTAIATPIDNSDMIVSSSRDKSIILWNLTKDEKTYGVARRRLTGHSHFVQDVVLSSDDNRQIVSASRDKTIKLWNTLGHSGYVNTVAVSPDGSLCASGGKDGVILLWDLAEGKRLYSLDAGAVINALCFSPNRYWLCAATENSIKIWDLESKLVVDDLKVDLKAEAEKSEGTVTATAASTTKRIYCTCLNWSADGSTLFSGYTDGVIRVWGVGRY